MLRSAAFGVALLAATFAVPSAHALSWEPKEEIKLDLSGDFRFRNEFNLVRTDAEDPMRYRPRIRLRVAGKAVFFKMVEVGLRLTTGDPADFNSPHQTLSDGFGKWSISLDRAYAKFSPKGGPEALDGSFVVAGKFAHPFETRPVYSNLTWDGDAQATGIAGALVVRAPQVLEALKWTGGLYAFAENKDSLNDGAVVVTQVSGRFKFGDAVSFLVGSGLYWLPDPQPEGNQAFVVENQGNALQDTDGDGEADAFVSDFAVIDTLIGVELDFGKVGLEVGGQVVANAAAETDNVGFGFGVAVPIEPAEGAAITPHFDYHQMDREANFTPWQQDDHQHGSPLRGISAGVVLSPASFFNFNLWVLADQDLDSPDDPWAVRLRVDANFRLK